MVKKLNWFKIPMGETAITPFGEFVVNIAAECYDLNFQLKAPPIYEWSFDSYMVRGEFMTIEDAKNDANQFWNEKIKECLQPTTNIYCVVVTREVEGQYIFHFECDFTPSCEYVEELIFAEDINYNPKYEKFEFWQIN